MTVKSPLPAPKVLLEGPTGTGKTRSIGTLVDAGVEVCYLALEQGYESLFGYWTDRGKPIPDNLFVHKVKAPKASFGDMATLSEKVGVLNFDSLIKLQDPQRSNYNQFTEVLRALNDFTDERSGRKLGPVDSWGTGRAIVIDGMTGLSRAGMNLYVGGRIAIDQKDWGLGQRLVENVLAMLTDQCRCWFVLQGHIERETDPTLGGSKITISTLGRALAPKIPPMFSDVILTVREGDKWLWSTAHAQADLKTRNLPWSDKLAPDFGAIVEKWKSRGGVLEPAA